MLIVKIQIMQNMQLYRQKKKKLYNIILPWCLAPLRSVVFNLSVSMCRF